MRVKSMWAAGLAALVVVGLAACTPTVKKAGPTPYDKTVVDDCYTVDLFTVAQIQEPEADVPSEWARYSGKWGSAAWEGKWCHDLYVLKIEPTGAVEVMSLHAPYEPWGKTATAFRRKGVITKDGRLRVPFRGGLMEYWVKNGKLYGDRKEGNGVLRIAMLPRVNAKF
ncbi:MAG: hypothetical protein AAF367_12430 [Pseudomonadota bacterium]